MKYVIWNPAGWLWENSFWCYFLTISVFLWSTCCFSLTQNKDAWEGFRVVEEYKREGRLLITKNNCWHWRHAFLNCFVNWKLQMFCREICKAHSTMDCGLAVMISRILFYLTLYLGISHMDLIPSSHQFQSFSTNFLHTTYMNMSLDHAYSYTYQNKMAFLSPAALFMAQCFSLSHHFPYCHMLHVFII